MTLRGDILRATKAAFAVYTESGARKKIEDEGYVRVNPIDIAAHAGLLVMLRPLESLLGAFIRVDTPGILLNSERSPGLIHMTCAHELGHYFMGHETTADVSVDYGPEAGHTELEADWFAYHLLMPRTLLAQLMRRKRWTDQSLRNPQILYQLSLRLGMSYSATVWSLSRQKLLQSDEAAGLSRIPPRKIKQSLLQETNIGTSDVWVLDPDDRDVVLEPRATDVFLVELPDHATAGYLWSVKQAQEEGFTLRPFETVPVATKAEIWLGSSGSRRYQLESNNKEALARRRDPMPLDFVESQPWVSSGSSDSRFVTTALFEEIVVGLSEASKESILEEVRSAS